MNRWHHRLKHPSNHVLLLVFAALTAILVQAGSLMIVDADRRYQVARWLWSGEPAMLPSDTAGVPNDRGEFHPMFGVGHSLLMVPPDIIAAAATRHFELPPDTERKIRAGLVSFVLAIALAILAAASARALLTRFAEFGEGEAIFGVVAFLLATSVLPYMQVHQENLLLTTLALAGAAMSLDWARTGARRSLLLSGGAAGFAILVRLPSVFLVGCLLLFAIAARAACAGGMRAWFSGTVRRDVLSLTLVWSAPVAFGLALDRLYQVARFGWGAIGTTYLSLMAERVAATGSEAPGWPYGGELADGLLGPLFDPQRSLLLIDPLLVLVGALAVVRFRRMSVPLRAYLLSFLFLLLLLIAFHARLMFWGGGFAWGPRYLLPAAQALALLAVPMLALEFRDQRFRPWRLPALAILTIALVTQVGAVTLTYVLEELQAQCAGRPRLITFERWANIGAAVTGTAPRGLECQEDTIAGLPALFEAVPFPFRNAWRLGRTAGLLSVAAWFVVFTAWVLTLKALLQRAVALSPNAVAR